MNVDIDAIDKPSDGVHTFGLLSMGVWATETAVSNHGVRDSQEQRAVHGKSHARLQRRTGRQPTACNITRPSTGGL